MSKTKQQAIESTAAREQERLAMPERIAGRAYQMYLERGREGGHDLDDWLRAEAELAAPSAS
jgi:hypothetical protein